MTNFLNLLTKRNNAFITNFSTESALGMVETLYGIKHDADPRKNCVLISFEPPLGHPPIVFNWSQADVWYFRNPEITEMKVEEIQSFVLESRFRKIVFLEGESSESLDKIHHFIERYEERSPEKTDFVLAEYTGPLSQIRLKTLKEGPRDTLLS